MEEKEPNVVETFLATKIAEFPTLYSCGDEVMIRCVFEKMGGSFWNKKGLIEQTDLSWDDKKKKYCRYPLQMPMKTALSLVNSNTSKILSFPYYYSQDNPIDCIPLNANDLWLKEIGHFLFKWGNYSLEQFELLAKAQCLINYGMSQNPHAHEPKRTLKNFEEFLKRVPGWKASIANVKYQMEHGKIKPSLYQALDI